LQKLLGNLPGASVVERRGWTVSQDLEIVRIRGVGFRPFREPPGHCDMKLTRLKTHLAPSHSRDSVNVYLNHPEKIG